MITDVTDFQKEVLERSKAIPVLVDFWAEWCGPCKILGPVLEKLAKENEGIWELAKLDTELHQDIAMQFNIQSIPNVKLFVDGRAIAEFVGALPEHIIRQWLQKEIPSRHTRSIEEAETLFETGNREEAQRILLSVLEKENGNEKARILLAKIYLDTDPEKALSLLKDVDESSSIFAAVESIRTFVDLYMKENSPEQLPMSDARLTYLSAIKALREQDFDTALEKFIVVIRRDRYYDEDGARKACLAIFTHLGEGHAITQKHRRDFNGALY